MTNKVLIGHVAGAHGIKGEVMIRAYTETPEGLLAYGPLEGEAGEPQLTITSVRTSTKGVIAKIAGIADRSSAEALRGRTLYVDRARMPAPDDGSYYLSDLVGLAVFDSDGATIGRVRGVENYGAGDLLAIETETAKGANALLVPFLDRFVPTVDMVAGRVIVVLPELVGEPEPAVGGGDEDDERGG